MHKAPTIQTHDLAIVYRERLADRLSPRARAALAMIHESTDGVPHRDLRRRFGKRWRGIAHDLIRFGLAHESRVYLAQSRTSERRIAPTRPPAPRPLRDDSRERAALEHTR